MEIYNSRNYQKIVLRKISRKYPILMDVFLSRGNEIKNPHQKDVGF